MSLQGAALRECSLDRLRLDTFDLLVIGGGIVGARVAFEAARTGLRVALVDAGDFGGATSSASGKLIHGCLRYLRTGGLASSVRPVASNASWPAGWSHTWCAGCRSC